MGYAVYDTDSEAKRLIEGGGVSIDQEKITNPFGEIPASSLQNKEFIDMKQSESISFL